MHRRPLYVPVLWQVCFLYDCTVPEKKMFAARLEVNQEIIVFLDLLALGMCIAVLVVVVSFVL